MKKQEKCCCFSIIHLTNIEHDIRTLINVCWEGNKSFLDEIAGYPLEYKPTNSEFIDMLAYYLREIEEEN